LQHAPDDEAVETLLVLRAMLRTHGLSLAHVHVRLNAAQLHSAIKADVGLDTSPADPANRRTYFTRINDLIGSVQPQTINFGSLAEEPSSARRLMMTVAQMSKFVDATTRVRFLVAETESGFTLLSALYLARLFGIEDQVEISPLYETEEGLADGERLIEEALRSPHFRSYLEKQGRLAIEFGFSDSGRFIGQMSATFRIERLRLRLAQLLEAENLTHLEVVFFNTHGESIGRGGHPDSLSDRFRYAAPPRSRAEYAERGIRVKEEDSFQGGEGYLPLLSPAAALATVRAALHAGLAPDPEAVGDPIYEEEDFASEFFASVQQAFTRLAATSEYPALLGLFGTHLLPKAGSRPTQRQAGDTGAPRPIGSVSELRAIPNNALLQQLGYLANTIYGVGPAAEKNPAVFARMWETSPRFRRALRMVSAAIELSDLQATRGYAGVLEPAMWLDRVRADPSCKGAATELSRLACMADAAESLAEVERALLVDRLDQPALLRPALADRSRRRRLQLLHGLRIAVIEKICLLAAALPPMPATAGLKREDLQLRLMRLDVPWALERLRELFPLQEGSGLQGADFGEPASYRPDVSHTHAGEHERLIRPLEALFDLAQRISTAVNHEIGACG
ncbi:MAG: phosphoenolpyruvate carboxylase, partial [Acetobacteraceae bacterium]|nr:phosphoenolpyruvate carboxylase [Acetobacteraceae bacterium]